MGVHVKMVTGDQIAIAQETAKQLGMGTNILNASGLGDDKKDATPEQAKAIEDADGFAQYSLNTNSTSSRSCRSAAISSA